jgi:tRNA (mo5U34)-methyltransferase
VRQLFSQPEGMTLTSSLLNIATLRQNAYVFESELTAQKKAVGEADFPWYPYGTMSNFSHLDKLLRHNNRDLSALIAGSPIADVGAADGDLAFFMESQGAIVDIIDYGPTNFNSLRGARLLKEARRSEVNIAEKNLDSYFEWPRSDYGLVFFLGILYHLKNPFYVLESLACVTRYALISTRVAQYSADYKTAFSHLPIGYLLHASEANNDPTNYWIFSEAGLKRLFDRTGWEVVEYATVGNTSKSDPASAKGDERAFALLRSRQR